MQIYLDLDGVMADFDAYFPIMFGVHHQSIPDALMWDHIHDYPTFFRDLPLCPGAKEFWREVEHLKPKILTACPADRYQEVAVQKREWCFEHLSPTVEVLPVRGGKNKWLFMHQPGDLLIDDFDKNLIPWRAAGGITIHHRTFEQTRREIQCLPI